MTHWARKHSKWVVAVLYAAFVLAWLAQALFFYEGDRMREQAPLQAAAARLEGLDGAGEGAYVSTGVDPQMIFEHVDHPVRQVLLTVSFTAYPGEMELFYTHTPGEGFSARRRVIGVPVQGGWLYTLPAGQVAALRLDLGTVSANTAQVGGITLNPRLPASHYFAPTLRTLALLLALPALASCAFFTIIELISSVQHFIAGRGKVSTD